MLPLVAAIRLLLPAVSLITLLIENVLVAKSVPPARVKNCEVAVPTAPLLEIDKVPALTLVPPKKPWEDDVSATVPVLRLLPILSTASSPPPPPIEPLTVKVFPATAASVPAPLFKNRKLAAARVTLSKATKVPPLNDTPALPKLLKLEICSVPPVSDVPPE